MPRKQKGSGSPANGAAATQAPATGRQIPSPHAPAPTLTADALRERLPALPFAMLRTNSETSASTVSHHAQRDTAELIQAACELPPLREEGLQRVVKPALRDGEEALLRRIRFRCALRASARRWRAAVLHAQTEL